MVCGISHKKRNSDRYDGVEFVRLPNWGRRSSGVSARKVIVDQTTATGRMPARNSRSHWRWVSFVVLLGLYAALTIAIVHPSAVLRLDRAVLDLDVRSRWPGWFPFIHTYVMLGQRAPTI